MKKTVFNKSPKNGKRIGFLLRPFGKRWKFSVHRENAVTDYFLTPSSLARVRAYMLRSNCRKIHNRMVLYL